MTNEFTTWWRKPIPRIYQVSLYNAPHPPYSPAHLSALSVASWKLQQGTCKSDSLDPANICLHRWPPWFRKCSQLNWATKSQQHFALPHTLQNQVLHAPKTLLETSLITPRAPNKPGVASSTRSPVLFTLLCCSRCLAHHLRLLRASAKHDHLLKAELKRQQKSPHSGLLPSRSTAQGQEYKHGLIC